MLAAVGQADGVSEYIDTSFPIEDQSNKGKWISNGTANYATNDG